MANGVTFGNYHTWEDFGLSMTEECFDTGYPELYENYVDVPGGTPLDYSELPAGHPVYKQRKMQGSFLKKLADMPWPEIVQKVTNALHGKEMDIILDEDPAWKYHGRVKVKKTVNRALMATKLDIEITALPYKEYKRALWQTWNWDDTDFGFDEYLKDSGEIYALSAGSATNYVFRPLENYPYFQVSVQATSVASGGGSIVLYFSGNAVKTINVTTSGRYYIDERVPTGTTNPKVTVTGINGTLKNTYTPRSF